MRNLNIQSQQKLHVPYVALLQGSLLLACVGMSACLGQVSFELVTYTSYSSVDQILRYRRRGGVLERLELGGRRAPHGGVHRSERVRSPLGVVVLLALAVVPFDVGRQSTTRLVAEC
jgi:hypothetical protein